jgi:uncharacterized membrane protein (DUF106 family)
LRTLDKAIVLLLTVLIAFSIIGLYATSVHAAGNVSCQVSLSAGSSTVNQATIYTVSISNNGQANIGLVGVTVPSGYKNIGGQTVTQKPDNENWNINNINNQIILNASDLGLSPGQTVAFTLNAKNPQPAGNYNWQVAANENSTSSLSSPDFTTSVSHSVVISTVDAAFIILSIAVVIAFINTVINRVLINYFVGWEQYRVMQKEMNEYRAETMKAARANDKKQMEKLKKRQSQINAMQQKMFKPQMVQFAISFVYIVIWIFVLTPTYGATSIVYLPGIGPLSVVYWYPICSFFLGLLAGRILGIMPIEP